MHFFPPLLSVSPRFIFLCCFFFAASSLTRAARRVVSERGGGDSQQNTIMQYDRVSYSLTWSITFARDRPTDWLSRAPALNSPVAIGIVEICFELLIHSDCVRQVIERFDITRRARDSACARGKFIGKIVNKSIRRRQRSIEMNWGISINQLDELKLFALDMSEIEFGVDFKRTPRVALVHSMWKWHEVLFFKNPLGLGSWRLLGSGLVAIQTSLFTSHKTIFGEHLSFFLTFVGYDDMNGWTFEESAREPVKRRGLLPYK